MVRFRGCFPVPIGKGTALTVPRTRMFAVDDLGDAVRNNDAVD